MSDQAKSPAKNRRQCGSVAGYRQHLKRGEMSCEECRAANTEYQRERRARLRGGETPKSGLSIVSTEVAVKRLPKRYRLTSVDGYPPLLGDAGRALWDALHEAYEIDQATQAALVDVCRMKDRLDQYAAALSDTRNPWFALDDEPIETMDGRVQFHVVVNPLLSEARQTQAALVASLAKLGLIAKASPKSEDDPLVRLQAEIAREAV